MEALPFTACISSIAVFILLAAPGYAAGKYKILSSPQISGLSVILVTFFWPAMVIDAMASVTVNEKLIHTAVYTGSITVIFYLASLVIGFLYTKIRKIPIKTKGILIFAITFNNTGLIGMPFIKSVLGNEALFIASIIELVNDIFIFSIGIMLIQHSADSKRKVNLKSFVSPGFLSVIAGLIIFCFHIRLPEIIAGPIRYMSDATTAAAMFLVGAQLGETSVRELFNERKAYETSFFRLLLIPLLLFIVLFILLKNRTLSDSVLVIMSAMPAAACTAIFARQHNTGCRHDNDCLLATKCVAVSTLLSAITLPLWLLVTSRF